MPAKSAMEIQRKTVGFTLLEMVIAMAIFAIIMIIVMGGLNMVVRAQEQVSVKAKRLGEIQLALTIIVRDLSQVVDRPIRDNNGELITAIIVDPNKPIRLEFTSGGVVNPNDQYLRSTLQRVGYGLEHSILIRYTWPVLDRVANTPLLRRHLLAGVEGFNVQYVNTRGEYVNDFGQAIALFIDIDLGINGHYQRTFALHNEANNEVNNAPKT